MTSTADDILVVGVGNSAMGDDGVGPALVSALRAADPTIATLVREGDLTDLALCWEGYESVIVIDACSTGRPVGDVKVFEPGDLAGLSAVSTHGLGVRDAVALAGHLGRMPRQLTVLGVEGTCFEPGPLSAEMSAALPDVVDAVEGIVGTLRAREALIGQDRSNE